MLASFILQEEWNTGSSESFHLTFSVTATRHHLISINFINLRIHFTWDMLDAARRPIHRELHSKTTQHWPCKCEVGRQGWHARHFLPSGGTFIQLTFSHLNRNSWSRSSGEDELAFNPVRALLFYLLDLFRVSLVLWALQALLGPVVPLVMWAVLESTVLLEKLVAMWVQYFVYKMEVSRVPLCVTSCVKQRSCCFRFLI